MEEKSRENEMYFCISKIKKIKNNCVKSVRFNNE